MTSCQAIRVITERSTESIRASCYIYKFNRLPYISFLGQFFFSGSNDQLEGQATDVHHVITHQADPFFQQPWSADFCPIIYSQIIGRSHRPVFPTTFACASIIEFRHLFRPCITRQWCVQHDVGAPMLICYRISRKCYRRKFIRWHLPPWINWISDN